METKEVITLLGIIVSLIVGSIGLIIGIRNSRKTIFINSVTKMRAEWIDKVRELISEFCALAYRYESSENKPEKQDRIQELRFLIRLKLNPKDEFDKKITELLNSISLGLKNHQYTDIDSEILQLIELSQNLLKLEWEGVKEESKRGNLSKKFKKRLYNKHLRNN